MVLVGQVGQVGKGNIGIAEHIVQFIPGWVMVKNGVHRVKVQKK